MDGMMTTGQNVLEQARLALEADRQARLNEFTAIIQRESQRLRVSMQATVEKVALGNGVFGDRAAVQFVAE